MEAARTEADETTRLLGEDEAVSGSDDRGSPNRRQKLLQKQIILLTLVLVLLHSHMIFFNRASAEFRLRQICHNYYKHHKPDGLGPGGRFDWWQCYFEEPVVQKFRELLNWDKGISSIILLLVVVPYGMIADIRGKKRVIVLGLVGQLLSCLWAIAVVSFPDVFPLQLTWAASGFWLIGGGTPLLTALIYLLASESLHEEQRSQLYFSLFGACLVIDFFMPTIALFASIPSVYLEVSLSLVFLCGCFVALKFVDESTIREEPRRSEDAESTVSHHPSEAAVLPDQDSRQKNLFSLLRSRKILFILVVFTLPVFAETAKRAFHQYFLVNRRPGQSLQEGFLALLPGEIVRVLLFTLFVPLAIPSVQKRWGVCQSAIDSWMIRGSLLLLAISCAFTTSATTFASRLIDYLVFVAGLGLRVSLLSYITPLARLRLRGRLYGIVQVAETIGSLIAWPIFEQTFVIVSGRKYPGLELPFVVMSVTSICALAVITFPRTSTRALIN